ncbi:MAG: hypothetical protein O9264_13070 [Leptospira sp.]|nr:hypothetical protein [Leptospira sp.]
MKPFHIKKYTEQRRSELGLTNGDLGRKLGRPEKSLRRLNVYFLTLKESPEFVLKLKMAIQAEERLWTEHLTNDLELIRQEELSEEQKEREQFKPYLWLIGIRSIPSPIFVVCLFGENRFRKRLLPEGISAFEESKQFQYTHQEFLAFSKENNGFAGPFGPIKGYLYRQTYDKAYEFDLEGKLVRILNGKFPKNKASFRIK